jgi:hypothetical protein
MPDFGSFRGFGEKLVQGQTPTQLGKIGSEDYSPLLLDAYPNASAAYSVRKLRTAYIGSAIRVRRSSDNAESDIGFTGLNLDTTTLTSFCGSGNGFVTTWYDQSGNARNAINSTAANQPQIVSSGSVFNNINGLPSIRFDGSNDSLQSSTYTTISPPYTAFLVNKWISTSAQPYLMDLGRDSAIGRLDISSPAKNGITFNGGTVNSTRLINFTDTLLWFVLPNGTSSNLSINNETIVSGGTGTRTTNQVTFGMYGGTTANANSYYTEFILYPVNQSSNRTGIESNINTYYGIY